MTHCPGTIRLDLAVLDGHVQFHDLSNPQVPNSLGSRFHRIPGRMLPRYVAGPNKLNDGICSSGYSDAPFPVKVQTKGFLIP